MDEASMKKLFDMHDKDGLGTIEKAELEALFKEANYSREEAEEKIKVSLFVSILFYLRPGPRCQ